MSQVFCLWTIFHRAGFRSLLIGMLSSDQRWMLSCGKKVFSGMLPSLRCSQLWYLVVRCTRNTILWQMSQQDCLLASCLKRPNFGQRLFEATLMRSESSTSRTQNTQEECKIHEFRQRPKKSGNVRRNPPIFGEPRQSTWTSGVVRKSPWKLFYSSMSNLKQFDDECQRLTSEIS